MAQKLQLNGSEGFANEHQMIENFKADFVLAAVVFEADNLTLRFPNYFRTRPNLNCYRTQDFWLTKCLGFLDAEDYYAREGFLALLYTIVMTQIEMEQNINFVKPQSFSSMNYRYLPKMKCVNDINGTQLSWQRFFLWSLYYFLYFVPFLNLLWVSVFGIFIFIFWKFFCETILVFYRNFQENMKKIFGFTIKVMVLLTVIIVWLIFWYHYYI